MISSIFNIGMKRFFEKRAYSGMSWSTNPGGDQRADPTTYPVQNPVMAASQRYIAPPGAVGVEIEHANMKDNDLQKGASNDPLVALAVASGLGGLGALVGHQKSESIKDEYERHGVPYKPKGLLAKHPHLTGAASLGMAPVLGSILGAYDDEYKDLDEYIEGL